MDKEPIQLLVVFVLGFLVGMYVRGILSGVTTATAPRRVVYGVEYQYDEKNNLRRVLPVPVPEVG